MSVGVRVHACVRDLLSCFIKDSEPCETSPLGVILGRSKCLFMCEGGECTGGGLSVLLWGASRGGARLAEPDASRGKHCRRNWFPDCGGICTFVWF